MHLVTDTDRQTTRKVRFVSEHHSTHLLRADWEAAAPVDEAAEDALIAHIEKAAPKAGAIVLSDYAKGTLTKRVVRAAIEIANTLGKPIIVDPKGRDYSIYRGATLITPNRQELAQVTHTTAEDDDEIVIAATALAEGIDAEAVLVTRSEQGMTLVSVGSGGARAGLSGARARRVRRRRYGGGGAFRYAGGGRRFRIGHARGQCGCRGGGGKARHRDPLDR